MHYNYQDINNNMHEYQKQAMQFIIENKYCGLFLDMGMGKTFTTLNALYNLNPNHHVLVIAPKNIARTTWVDEIKKWKMPLRTKSLIVDDNGKNLSKGARWSRYNAVFDELPTIYFINKDLIVDLVEHMPKISGKIQWPFQSLVIDESQFFKSNKSKRFKALKKVRPAIDRVILLSGTPTPNGLLDLWSQIYLLDMGQRLETSMSKYISNYFDPHIIIDNRPVSWKPKQNAETMIYDKIKDIVISIENTAIKLPEIRYNDAVVYMDPHEQKLYNKMKRDLVLSLDGQEIKASNRAVLCSKLQQMASGALYTDDKHNYKIIHKKKLDYVGYLIRNANSPILIAYHFKSDLNMLQHYINDELKIPAQVFDGSSDMVHAWNRQEIPIMLIQPISAGTGLNLQEGGHTLIWYTIPWSLESYKQCNARIYRQGQTRTTIIHHLLTHDTIDSRILNAIIKKDMSLQALINAVKAELM